MKARKRLFFAFPVVASAVVLGVGWAITAGGEAGAASSAAATWTPGGILPGRPTAVTSLSAREEAGLQAALAISRRDVDASTVREVVSGGVFGLGMRLVVARDAAGNVCTSVVIETGGGRSFSCFQSDETAGALVRYIADGGTKLGKADWVSMVGLARGDVARVTLVSRDGSEHELALNSWRGFTYSADSPRDFPARLRAYDASGSLIAEEPTLP